MKIDENGKPLTVPTRTCTGACCSGLLPCCPCHINAGLPTRPWADCVASQVVRNVEDGAKAAVTGAGEGEPPAPPAPTLLSPPPLLLRKACRVHSIAAVVAATVPARSLPSPAPPSRPPPPPPLGRGGSSPSNRVETPAPTPTLNIIIIIMEAADEVREACPRLTLEFMRQASGGANGRGEARTSSARKALTKESAPLRWLLPWLAMLLLFLLLVMLLVLLVVMLAGAGSRVEVFDPLFDFLVPLAVTVGSVDGICWATRVPMAAAPAPALFAPADVAVLRGKTLVLGTAST